MVTRRFFIGGLAGMFALGPRRVFAAAPGVFTSGTPALSFGVLSDVHIGISKGGKALSQTHNTDTLIKAFKWFRDNGADAVVIAGDMAHHGCGGELMAVAEAWFSVFPGDKAPNGRKVERIFVFGNHDWGEKRAKAIFSTPEDLAANTISANPQKWWSDAFHEDWSPFFRKEVNGYGFVGAHWCIGDCRGKDENFTKGFKEYYDSIKGKINPALPFFHVQHPHPKATVHGEKVWGQDNGMSVAALSAYPNAVSFSGHSHTSLTDERSIWQGAFTAVGCGTLRNVSIEMPGVLPNVEDGLENGSSPKSRKSVSAIKAMKVLDRMNCRQGQFVRVYSDRTVISRREFVTGATLCDDLVMPLPAAEKRPFEFTGRMAKAKPPAFPAGATLTAKKAKGRLRGTGKKDPDADIWKIEIPAAIAEPSARPAIYKVVAKSANGAEKTFKMSCEGMRFPATDPRASAPVVMKIACSRLPADVHEFSAMAVSCWGRVSAPLTVRI